MVTTGPAPEPVEPIVLEEYIQAVSNYLYYSMDEWGKANTASFEDQCMIDSDCVDSYSMGFTECCASITMSAMIG